jgi:preprotein translocase subunit SecE
METYEAVTNAFTKAKTAFIRTLNEELKKVK